MIASGKTVVSEHHWFGNGYSYNDTCEKELLQNPFCLINDHVENKFFYAKYYSVHTLKGWTNGESWKVYLLNLRYKYLPPVNSSNFYDRSNRIYLIINRYGSHKTEEIDDFAINLNIDIILIPRGLTHIYQPLDFMIFGMVKSRQKSFMNDQASKILLSLFDQEKNCFIKDIPPINGLTKKEAASLLQVIWDEIPDEDIIKAFDGAISSHFNEIENDPSFSEDYDFEKKLFELKSRCGLNQTGPNQPRFYQSRLNQAELNQPELYQPRLNQPRLNRAELNQPELYQPRLNQPRLNRAELNQHELYQPGLNQPGLNQSELYQPRLNRAELNQPELYQPGLNQPGLNRAELNQPELYQPRLNRAELNQPELYQPGLNRAELNQPELFQP